MAGSAAPVKPRNEMIAGFPVPARIASMTGRHLGLMHRKAYTRLQAA
jgi:hypothetical protein